MKVQAVLCLRRYGRHEEVKRIDLPNDYHYYIDVDTLESRNQSAINEDYLIEDLPKDFLPVPVRKILLIAERPDSDLSLGMMGTNQFRSWAKYFDAYSLTVEKKRKTGYRE